MAAARKKDETEVKPASTPARRRGPSPALKKARDEVEKLKKRVNGANKKLRERAKSVADPAKAAGISGATAVVSQMSVRAIQAAGEKARLEDPESMVAKLANPRLASGIVAGGGVVLGLAHGKLPKGMQGANPHIVSGMVAPFAVAMGDALFDKVVESDPAALLDKALTGADQVAGFVDHFDGPVFDVEFTAANTDRREAALAAVA